MERKRNLADKLLATSGKLTNFKEKSEVQTMFRGTQQENFGKILETSFSAFLDCFSAFFYLCKLIQLDLFGVFR